jgi:hypothetical protein
MMEDRQAAFSGQTTQLQESGTLGPIDYRIGMP